MHRHVFLILPAFFLAACEQAPVPEEAAKGALSAQEPVAQEGKEVRSRFDTAGLGPMSSEEFRDLARRALSLLEEGKGDEARQLVVEALELRPGHPGLMRLLTFVEMVEENWESVVDLTTQRLARDPDALEFMGTRAEARFMLQDIDGTQRDLLDLIDRIEKAPGGCESPDYLRSAAKAFLATTYYSVGDLEEAERMAQEVLKDQPKTLQARFVQALVANKRDDIDGALKIYKEILKEAPSCSACLNNIGVLHYRQHRLAEARNDFLAALKETSPLDRHGLAIVHSNLADLLVLEGKYKKAEARYREAISASSRYSGPYYGLAQLYDIEGRLREARAMMQQALLLDPMGLDHYNSEFIEPEWRWHLEALMAEARGNGDHARGLFEKVAQGSVEVLRQAAMRHL